jgi:hypothetical protein
MQSLDVFCLFDVRVEQIIYETSPLKVWGRGGGVKYRSPRKVWNSNLELAEYSTLSPKYEYGAHTKCPALKTSHSQNVPSLDVLLSKLSTLKTTPSQNVPQLKTSHSQKSHH